MTVFDLACVNARAWLDQYPQITMTEKREIVRHPVDYNYNQLDWEFIHAMAQIGHYGHTKYGSKQEPDINSWMPIAEQLTGDKSPTNHIAAHLAAYNQKLGHDFFTENEYNLAAIAYNAMMEWRKAKLAREKVETSDEV